MDVRNLSPVPCCLVSRPNMWSLAKRLRECWQIGTVSYIGVYATQSCGDYFINHDEADKDPY